MIWEHHYFRKPQNQLGESSQDGRRRGFHFAMLHGLSSPKDRVGSPSKWPRKWLKKIAVILTMESSGMILQVSVKQCIRPESVKKGINGPCNREPKLPSCHKEEYPLNCLLHILLVRCWKSYSIWARRILQLA